MDARARFGTIGERITRRWHARARDERAFPEIAQRELQEGALQAVPFAELIQAALGPGALPLQADMEASFGQPPLTLYRGEGFQIEILFWVDALLSVHRHRFSGAFAVLTGSSIHCRYRFEEERRVCSALLLGRLDLLESELLAAGDCRPIHAGSESIHATFHLERPTVSVVARTITEWGMGPPYDYRRPSVAFDPAYEGRMIRKRLQVLDMLRRARPDDYASAAIGRLEHEDLFGSYLVLEQLFQATSSETSRAGALAAARQAHGSVVDALLPSLLAQDHMRQLMSLRARSEDAELSFFLALLANVPSRRPILALVAARYPGLDPVERIMGWLERMPGELHYAPLAGSSAVAALVRRALAGETGLGPELAPLAQALVLGPLLRD